MLKENKIQDAKRFDRWEILGVWYSLCVLGLWVEIYKLAERDPTYAKLLLRYWNSAEMWWASDYL